MSALVRSMLAASIADTDPKGRQDAGAPSPLRTAGFQPAPFLRRLVERDAADRDAVLAEIKRRGMWWAADEIVHLRRATRARS